MNIKRPTKQSSITIRLTGAERETLELTAKSNRVSISDVIRMLINVKN